LAFTITFPTIGPRPTPTDVAEWLTEQGEAFDAENPGTFALRALPVHVVLGTDDGPMQAWIDVEVETPLVRLVDLVFALSIRAGADVKLAGAGEMTRARLWVRLADEQDRLRIARAISRSEEHGNREDVLQRLWAVLAVLHPGHDLRWDAQQQRIVEMLEVGGPAGISVDEARWLEEDAVTGDVVPRPVEGYLHVVAWRWLSDAWPGLAED
jgi:hypothetical protein